MSMYFCRHQTLGFRCHSYHLLTPSIKNLKSEVTKQRNNRAEQPALLRTQTEYSETTEVLQVNLPVKTTGDCKLLLQKLEGRTVLKNMTNFYLDKILPVVIRVFK